METEGIEIGGTILKNPKNETRGVLRRGSFFEGF